MLFWVIAAVLTAIVTLALLGPVARARSAASEAPARHDMEVYRDQLAEVDRDLADGLVDEAQAEVARTEISRRLLAASRKSEAEDAEDTQSSNRSLRQIAVYAVAIFMPLTAVTAYLELGRPDLPQLPLAARLQSEPENTDIAMLVARAEQHLAQNPEDGRGWAVLGPIYMRTGRFAESAEAFRKSIALLGPSPARLASLGEALFSASGGIVTEEAMLAFQTARELDPNDPRPQFFLAVGMVQAGKRDEARAAFTAMMETAPEGAPWIAAVESQIAALDTPSGPLSGPVTGAGALAPGNPSAADIAAAQDMSPEDRQAMIGSMVESLEARLADNPDNIEGWLRLVRSHMVMGNRDRAQAALDRAFAAFSNASTETQALTGAARELGLVASSTLGGVPVASASPAEDAASANQPEGTTTPFILEGVSPETSAAPAGPTQDDVAAAAAMSDQDRDAMIRGMVASLDARLADNPNNIEGWLRLVRSYAVLGDEAAAGSALKRASATFPGATAEGQALAALAAQLGLETELEGQ
ncbi:cytochrome c-type biogenesis protein CcmI [Hoeflea phototrophica DFL-43]|jgi:cytochrome c-type biogenesis protein CcmH|uniref:Cytochrome c-type biogenesis protein CcmI n=1 Tax=Hoeflea phototrophica (strain DSM 17068 / NCIMB 14078 / DFL-43) TaxID=411684 RepID=A9D3Z5_HOEPD|nr:c-type cytochrome biogenesis protein CcmI [Hoeflea phototrophica]EDQ33778.1 cytochrome c-type biogenesis protein CcmI [Hoeflea phototrophica DFL-43]